MGQLINCGTDRQNLGVSKCKQLPRIYKGMITTGPDFALTLEQAQTPAAWQAAILAEASARVYYWPTAVAMENISTETVYETTPLSTMNVDDGNYIFRLSFQENLQYHKAMFSHQGFQGRVFFIDKKNRIVGTSIDGVNFQGFTIDLLNPEKLVTNDGTITSKTPVYIALEDNLELDEFGCMIEGDFLKNIIRLTTVNVEVVSAAAAGIVVRVTSDLDGGSLLGLTDADFIVLDVAGVAQAFAGSVDNGDGTYDLPPGTVFVDGTVNLNTADSLTVTGFEAKQAVEFTV